MEREEILKKSREENEDEGQTFIDNKSRRYGVMGFCLMFAVIVFFNLLTDQPNYLPNCMFFAYLAAEALGKYDFTKRKGELAAVIMGALASVLTFAAYAVDVLLP